jgi:hypothetical protein
MKNRSFSIVICLFIQTFFHTGIFAGGDVFSDTLVFDLSSAEYSAEGLNSYVEFPVYFTGQNDTVNAVDFWFPFNTTKLTFISTSSLFSTLDVYSNYITSNETLSCTASTFSIFEFLPAGTQLVAVKFQLNNACDRIEIEDIIDPQVLLNGNEVAYIVTNPLQVSIPEVQILSSAPYCPGASISFSYPTVIDGQGINSYNWNFGNGTTASGQSPTVEIAVEGINTITLQMVTDLGCSYEAVSSINISVGPNASFESSVVPNSTEVAFNSTSTIEDGSITGYSWNFGDGSAASTAEDPTHEFPTSGPYQVTLTVTSDIGCIDAFTTTVNVPVGIEETTMGLDVRLFPNPAESWVCIQSNREMNYNLHDNIGKLISSGTLISAKPVNIDVRLLSSGVYYFTFDDGEFITRKMLVVR